MKPEEVGKYMGVIGEGVKKLAMDMKQPVEQVYELFLRQNYVQAAINIFEVLAFTAMWVAFIKFVKWGLRKDNDSSENWFYYNGGVAFVTVAVGLILFVISVFVYFIGIEDTITRLINPHYATIKDIIELVKPNGN